MSPHPGTPAGLDLGMRMKTIHASANIGEFGTTFKMSAPVDPEQKYCTKRIKKTNSNLG